MLRVAVVSFPGSNCETETVAAAAAVGAEAYTVWHAERDLGQADIVILPGGFAHGDALRAGAIARFSPIMGAVSDHARAGGPTLGICNGFQVLCEAGLLPGALVRNEHLEFRCEWVNLRVERTDTMFTNTAHKGQLLRVPISHGEGNWQADAETLRRVEDSGQVLLRYADDAGSVSAATNPNGSMNGIAGIVNEQGNVLGLMPHPEKACEELIGGADGNVLFASMIRSAEAALQRA